MQYKNEFSKIKQKKLINAIKFANIISLGEMSFDQHYSFIQEGIITFEEQCKKLNEIKKEKEKEKEQEQEQEQEQQIIECEKKDFENEEDYDIVLDDIKKESFDLILNNEGINNCNNNIYNNKNKIKNQSINTEGNNEKSRDKDKEDEGKGRRTKGGRRNILGRKRNSVSNSVKNYLMMDLEYSIDDFIYNKRDFRINGYDSFFLNIQSKISKNSLNNHGLNVSVYFFNI